MCCTLPQPQKSPSLIPGSAIVDRFRIAPCLVAHHFFSLISQAEFLCFQMECDTVAKNWSRLVVWFLLWEQKKVYIPVPALNTRPQKVKPAPIKVMLLFQTPVGVTNSMLAKDGTACCCWIGFSRPMCRQPPSYLPPKTGVSHI